MAREMNSTRPLGESHGATDFGDSLESTRNNVLLYRWLSRALCCLPDVFFFSEGAQGLSTASLSCCATMCCWDPLALEPAVSAAGLCIKSLSFRNWEPWCQKVGHMSSETIFY